MAKTGKSKIIAAVCAVVLLIASAVAADFIINPLTDETSSVAMGSAVTVKIIGKDKNNMLSDIVSSLREIENENISRYKETSEIYKLNEKGELVLGDFTADALAKALEISGKSGGAFDITVGELSSLWDFDNSRNGIPEKSEIERTVEYCGYEKVKRSGNSFALGEGQTVDLGAVGKGLGCDAAAEILKRNNVKGAVVSVGGTILTLGKNGLKNWILGIRTPEKNENGYFATLELSGENYISTSGSYEKSFEKDGKIYHHILSPETGYPAESGLLGVTVISGCGLVSDALSTACFVLGYEKSQNLLKEYGAKAIFITEKKKVRIYGEFGDSLKIKDGSYEII